MFPSVSLRVIASGVEVEKVCTKASEQLFGRRAIASETLSGCTTVSVALDLVPRASKIESMIAVDCASSRTGCILVKAFSNKLSANGNVSRIENASDCASRIANESASKIEGGSGGFCGASHTSRPNVIATAIWSRTLISSKIVTLNMTSI